MALAVLRHLKRHIERILRDDDLRIDKAVRLSVRELVAPFVGIFKPVYLDVAFIDRSLERSHRKSLRHSGDRTEVSVCVVGDYQKVAVAVLVSLVLGLTLAVTVVRVAVEASATDHQRAEAAESPVLVLVEIPFKEHLSVLEGLDHSGVLDHRSRLLVG